MPLATPPEVRIGDDPTWHPLQTVPSPPAPGGLQRPLGRSAVEYRYWLLQVTLPPATAPETVTGRLLVAGPAAVAVPSGAVVLPSGSHSSTLRFVDSPEAPELEADGRLVVD